MNMHTQLDVEQATTTFKDKNVIYGYWVWLYQPLQWVG